VYGLLAQEGLDRYYVLGGGRGATVTTWGRSHDHKWLEELLAATSGATRGVRQVALDVQGIHCAACVWLFEELFRREQSGIGIVVNPALGRMDLSVGGDFALDHFVDAIERFGYVLGPPRKGEDAATSKASELLLRTGACVAIAMNAMIFAFAIYAGLDGGPIYRFFQALTFALATVSVLVGGTVFFRSAWTAVRQRVLHLDVPIALGIVLAYSGSAYSLFAQHGRAAYFDTVSVFIALMLVGRFLQERVLERNRRQILSDDGVDALFTRVIDAGGATRLVRCREVGVAARLLVAPGDLVPIECVVESDGASISLDWINGESAPREVRRGEVVPAGSFNVGRAAVTLRATAGFDASPIATLLRSPRPRERDAARATPWWRTFTRLYVGTVLLVAAGAFATWMLTAHDIGRALEVTTAVLVVTCPCAFGIATPMAYEIVQAGLRRAGVFIRSASFLDRAVDVHRVVFDKTGTLTTGALTVDDPSAFDQLSARERHVLYNLSARSTHPKSAAIARALGRHVSGFAGPSSNAEATLEEEWVVVEHAGRGLELVCDGHRYRLGSGAFVGESGATDDVVFGMNGCIRARFAFRESLRPDAKREVEALGRSGYEVWILSGDAAPRVDTLAARVGVPAERAVGDRTPEGKAEWLAATDRSDTLMVGDGLNDGLATERAFASATPAIDRPFMPARTDLYFTSAGLQPVRMALAAARALRRVTQRNLRLAVAYNLVTVALAYAGLMTPLLCAVVMPASSLSIVLATVVSLKESASWRS
jgi:Cu2+-exporting ATPase